MDEDDKAVVVLISSDEEDVASKPGAKKRKCMADDKVAAAERSGRSGGVHVATREEESRVLSDMTGLEPYVKMIAEVEILKSRRRKNKRNKKKINCASQDKIGDDAVKKGEQLDTVKADLGTNRVLQAELVVIPDNDTPQKLLVYAADEEVQADKFEDIETAKAICESVRSMDVTRISSSSEEDEDTVKLNSSNVDEGMLLAQPIDEVKEGVHPDKVKVNGTEGKQVDTDKSIKKLKVHGKNSVEESNNIVLQKLLRGPRYFDPHERNREMCCHCGEEGHKTVMCTAKNRKKPCFVCAGFGHNGMSCKQGLECFNCKGIGHYARQCPNKNEENCPTSNICLRCGDSGHDMWTCNSDYPHEDLKEIQCHACKNFGHLCCVDYPDLGSRQVSCCNCGKSGHVGSVCTEGIEKPSGPRTSKSCYKCGEKGHTVRQCEKQAKVKKSQGISKEKKDYLGSKSAPHDVNKAQGRIKPSKEEKDSLGSKSAPHDVNKAQGRIKTPSKEEKDSLGSKSAPHDVNKAQGRIKTPSKEEKDSLGSKSAPHDINKAQGRIKTPSKAEKDSLGSKSVPHDVNKAQGRIKTPSKEEKYSLGSKSAPHDVNKAQGRIKTPCKERASTTAVQPRGRNERNVDGRRTLCFSAPGSNVWRVPSTSGNNNDEMSAVYSSQNLSCPQNPIQMFNHFGTPGSQACQPAKLFQETSAPFAPGNFLIPQNPFQMFNSPPVPDSQSYLPARNYQETSTFPASQNPFQMFNSPPVPGSQAYLPARNYQETSNLPASRNFSIPQNPVQMFNHHATPPGSQAYLPARNYQETSNLPASRKFSIPQNPVQMFNHHATPPGSQAYLPARNYQETSNLPASRNFSIPQNPVQMFNLHATPPGSQAYQATFGSPWPRTNNR